ncbi:MAG: hypothetical protein BGO25_10445 [Acidobacteriales bacterium 59-55]|nr:hypothetical protein [Terriglobales bacterium]OJV43603.1 MAG: hypothetical protein BGO25_10445 [Acidobacteriales bacterium 59-55]
MSTLPSFTEEDTTRRASSFSTYFVSRVVIAILLTGFDGFVFLKSAAEEIRNSLGMPLLHWLLIAAVIGIALSLANVWYKTLRYRHSSKPGSWNPFR